MPRDYPPSLQTDLPQPAKLPLSWVIPDAVVCTAADGAFEPNDGQMQSALVLNPGSQNTTNIAWPVWGRKSSHPPELAALAMSLRLEQCTLHLQDNANCIMLIQQLQKALLENGLHPLPESFFYKMKNRSTWRRIQESLLPTSTGLSMAQAK